MKCIEGKLWCGKFHPVAYLLFFFCLICIARLIFSRKTFTSNLCATLKLVGHGISFSKQVFPLKLLQLIIFYSLYLRTSYNKFVF